MSRKRYAPEQIGNILREGAFQVAHNGGGCRRDRGRCGQGKRRGTAHAAHHFLDSSRTLTGAHQA